MKSPCVAKCVYDYTRNNCTGCFRTLEEIGRWWQMSITEKSKVLEDCELRRKKYSAQKEVVR